MGVTRPPKRQDCVGSALKKNHPGTQIEQGTFIMEKAPCQEIRTLINTYSSGSGREGVDSALDGIESTHSYESRKALRPGGKDVLIPNRPLQVHASGPGLQHRIFS